MTLCTCPERPRCSWRWCEDGADWSVWQRAWGSRSEGPTFMCKGHFRLYQEAMTKPIRGIDRPEHADDEWRGSITEMMRHARIAIDFAERDQKAKAIESMGSLRRDGDEKYTLAQLQQMKVLRNHLRTQHP